ncbi:unnamed protein product [Amoebophrya sp. A25]|nr:unnamed protein product [Amoebophrya sp. A25]|eukprot:GSA25T00004440001.1
MKKLSPACLVLGVGFHPTGVSGDRVAPDAGDTEAERMPLAEWGAAGIPVPVRVVRPDGRGGVKFTTEASHTADPWWQPKAVLQYIMDSKMEQAQSRNITFADAFNKTAGTGKNTKPYGPLIHKKGRVVTRGQLALGGSINANQDPRAASLLISEHGRKPAESYPTIQKSQKDSGLTPREFWLQANTFNLLTEEETRIERSRGGPIKSTRVWTPAKHGRGDEETTSESEDGVEGDYHSGHSADGSEEESGEEHDHEHNDGSDHEDEDIHTEHHHEKKKKKHHKRELTPLDFLKTELFGDSTYKGHRHYRWTSFHNWFGSFLLDYLVLCMDFCALLGGIALFRSVADAGVRGLSIQSACVAAVVKMMHFIVQVEHADENPTERSDAEITMFNYKGLVLPQGGFLFINLLSAVIAIAAVVVVSQKAIGLDYVGDNFGDSVTLAFLSFAFGRKFAKHLFDAHCTKFRFASIFASCFAVVLGWFVFRRMFLDGRFFPVNPNAPAVFPRELVVASTFEAANIVLVIPQLRVMRTEGHTPALLGDSLMLQALGKFFRFLFFVVLPYFRKCSFSDVLFSVVSEIVNVLLMADFAYCYFRFRLMPRLQRKGEVDPGKMNQSAVNIIPTKELTGTIAGGLQVY